MECIKCKQDTASKVIYAGLPVKFCLDDECHCLWGFWSYLMLLLPFNGWFIAYDGTWYSGEYFLALWQFMKHGFEEKDIE